MWHHHLHCDEVFYEMRMASPSRPPPPSPPSPLLRQRQNVGFLGLDLRGVKEIDILPPGHPAAGKTGVDGNAAAYVCIGNICGPPITDPKGLKATLRGS